MYHLERTIFLQVLNEKKLQEVDSLWKEFETPEKANKM
jgi:nucleolar protein 58